MFDGDFWSRYEQRKEIEKELERRRDNFEKVEDILHERRDIRIIGVDRHRLVIEAAIPRWGDRLLVNDINTIAKRLKEIEDEVSRYGSRVIVTSIDWSEIRFFVEG